MTSSHTLSCALCTWEQPFTFDGSAIPEDKTEAQGIVAAMGAAVFDHELRKHMRDAHPLTSEVGVLGQGAFRITRREGAVVGIEVWPDRAHPERHILLRGDL